MWLKTDWDFGLNVARLVVNIRTSVGRKLVAILQEKQDDPQSVANFLQVAITNLRPELKGVIVFSMRYSWRGGGLCLQLDISHPSLPRVKMMEEPKEQYLEPCPVCKGPVYLADGGGWGVVVPTPPNDSLLYKELLCCSKECSKVAQSDAEAHPLKEVKPPTDSNLMTTMQKPEFQPYHPKKLVPFAEQEITDSDECIIHSTKTVLPDSHPLREVKSNMVEIGERLSKKMAEQVEVLFLGTPEQERSKHKLDEENKMFNTTYHIPQKYMEEMTQLDKEKCGRFIVGGKKSKVYQCQLPKGHKGDHCWKE